MIWIDYGWIRLNNEAWDDNCQVYNIDSDHGQ